MQPCLRWCSIVLALAVLVGCAQGHEADLEGGPGTGGSGNGTDSGTDGAVDGDVVDEAQLDTQGSVTDVGPSGGGEASTGTGDTGGPGMDTGPGIDVVGTTDTGGGMDVAPACGDGLCTGGETCTTCPTDCGTCPDRCGDHTCGPTESCTTCPSDCGACTPRCGDGTCNGSETCSTCPTDCGACPDPCPASVTCGDCAMRAGCGWCANLGRCYGGTASGPTSRACAGSNWDWSASACMSTASDPCSVATDCLTCTGGATCGWCGSTGQCLTGTGSGPNNHACAGLDWSWVDLDCP